MSRSRISSEWGFGRCGVLWNCLRLKEKMQVYEMPVASMYFTAWLLTNCHTCMYGNVVSAYFNLQPPSLDAYLDLTGNRVPLV